MDDRGVKVAWWRVLALRLRAMTGWGLNIPGLRRWARVYVIQAVLDLAATVIFPSIIIVIYNVLPRFDIGDSRIVPIPVILRGAPPLIALFLLFAALSFSLSALHRRRARAGASQPLATFYGMCLATAHAPPLRFFALVSPSREVAQWFSVPKWWDTAIGPGSDQFGVVYDPATGFVEQVKRLGAEARTLTQPAESYAAPGTTEATPNDADANDGEATRAQRREITRMYQRASAYWCISWGTSTQTMLALGLTMLICAIFYEVAPVAMIVATGAYPGHPHRSDFQTVVIASAIMAVVGVGCLLSSIYIMRVWLRFWRSDALDPAIFQGDLVCWTPRGPRNGQATDVLALAQADDGARIVFRIPRKWAHRVWQGAGPIRVTYNAVSGYVLDYRPLPPTST